MANGADEPVTSQIVMADMFMTLDETTDKFIFFGNQSGGPGDGDLPVHSPIGSYTMPIFSNQVMNLPLFLLTFLVH